MEETCPICNRELGNVWDKHHLVPKTFKGDITINIHKMCHNKIHSVFTERELSAYYHTVERIMENEHMQTFVKWISKKPPNFYTKTKDTSRRKSKRSR